jgi:hypothetical protein
MWTEIMIEKIRKASHALTIAVIARFINIFFLLFSSAIKLFYRDETKGARVLAVSQGDQRE